MHPLDTLILGSLPPPLYRLGWEIPRGPVSLTVRFARAMLTMAPSLATQMYTPLSLASTLLISSPPSPSSLHRPGGSASFSLTNESRVLGSLSNQRQGSPDPLQGEQLPGPGHCREGLTEELHSLTGRYHCVHGAENLHLDRIRASLASLYWATNK